MHFAITMYSQLNGVNRKVHSPFVCASWYIKTMHAHDKNAGRELYDKIMVTETNCVCGAIVFHGKVKNKFKRIVLSFATINTN